jgi:hypothetical protein
MNSSMNPRQRNFIVGLIVIGLMIIGIFGLRTVRAFRQFHGHRPPPPFTGEKVETDVDLIRDWMTLPYISITYRLPPDLLYETLKIPPRGNERKSLKELNDQYYPEAPGTVLELVKAAIRAYQPPTTAAPSETPDTAGPAVTSVPQVEP